ncbi:riboflavin biosynthesis protein RibD [Syntrophotalea acetylenivorans]|uniref:Riboflavin biosynthesis protein RibD n=1 Tax=Syntrophotalea acetylenivorans TaxID=1842532 RepID=A0A1L3GL90_9BACT|nr:bifunctional diaminohydroxyphosphoribosylaminopyrimidine deaminase/5-amino-6-(5-phosphoribosylamino)uracil reductase RibD [Syntrophotalea acetylenivorans]APG26716.1 riboflavin biosynthesis protein RibD [Syntrophotalea acetylenivorans]
MEATADRYMRRALELGAQAEGRTRPNPAVGAVVVADNQIVGEGFHPAAGQPHAEVFALQAAAERAVNADLYVTLEPCSHQGRTGPCTEVIIAAGIRRVFVGTQDPNPQVAGSGIRRLQQAGIQVAVGLRDKECRRLIAPFAKHVTTGLPFVILKSAVTLDGQTATSTGDSQWISNSRSREEVHRLRDRVDAIMVGVGTVLHDDPKLTTRLPGGRDPLRIVVDSQLRTPPQATLLHLDSSAETLIAHISTASVERRDRLLENRATLLKTAESDGRVDLHDLLAQLGRRGVQSVLLEGGAQLNAAFLKADLIDRMMIFVAPKVIGGNGGFGIFAGEGFARLADAKQLQDIRFRQFGDDILIEGEVIRCLPA